LRYTLGAANGSGLGIGLCIITKAIAIAAANSDNMIADNLIAFFIFEIC
jgi:hypothetical protein